MEKADQYKIFDVEKSDIKSDNFVVNYGEIKMTRDQEIASISKEIEELHHLDESHWAIRKQREASTSLGVQKCIGSYNAERKIIRVKIDIKAPLIKVLTYMMEPPFGLKNAIIDEACNPEVLEKLGKGAIIEYNEMPEKNCCLFTIAARECVGLRAVKILTANTAIFGVKSVEHKKQPLRVDAYRVDVPLMGSYLYAEGDVVHVESYFAEVDIGGKIGKLGCCLMMEHWFKEAIKLADKIPQMPDVTAPPYVQFL